MKDIKNQLYSLKEVGVEHLKAGRYQKAAVYFKDILDKFEQALPEAQDQSEMQNLIRQLKLSSHKNLSLCHLKLKQYKNCIQECQKVLEIEPNNIKMLYRVGRSYLENGQFDDAQTYLKKGFHINPLQKQIMKALEEVEAHRNSISSASAKPSLVLQLRDLIIWIISIIFWLPRYFLNKGKEITNFGADQLNKLKK